MHFEKKLLIFNPLLVVLFFEWTIHFFANLTKSDFLTVYDPLIFLGLDCDFKSVLLEAMFHRIAIDAHIIQTKKNYYD